MLGCSESRISSTVNMITFTPSVFRRGKDNPIQSCQAVVHYGPGKCCTRGRELVETSGWNFGTNNQTLLSWETSLPEGKTTEAVCFY